MDDAAAHLFLEPLGDQVTMTNPRIPLAAQQDRARRLDQLDEQPEPLLRVLQLRLPARLHVHVPETTPPVIRLPESRLQLGEAPADLPCPGFSRTSITTASYCATKAARSLGSRPPYPYVKQINSGSSARQITPPPRPAASPTVSGTRCCDPATPPASHPRPSPGPGAPARSRSPSRASRSTSRLAAPPETTASSASPPSPSSHASLPWASSQSSSYGSPLPGDDVPPREAPVRFAGVAGHDLHPTHESHCPSPRPPLPASPPARQPSFVFVHSSPASANDTYRRRRGSRGHRRGCRADDPHRPVGASPPGHQLRAWDRRSGGCVPR